ncbi:hypothetical protein MK489_17950 [Myxococcota bacterium]|nr:hypothetical protein [Myxococcota bacterium]
MGGTEGMGTWDEGACQRAPRRSPRRQNAERAVEEAQLGDDSLGTLTGP